MQRTEQYAKMERALDEIREGQERIAGRLLQAERHLTRAGGLLLQEGAEPPARGSELLVVDLEPASRSALADLLRDCGYVVREAGSPDDLPGDGELLPALVILDPGPFVAAALGAVRAMAARPGAPAVLVLSATSGDDGALTGAAGCVECLAKPCSPADLIGAVQRIVGAPVLAA